MKNIDITKAVPGHLDRLRAIGQHTFFETFAAVNTEENMRKYLEEEFSSEKLAAALGDENVEFHFAKLGGTIIGYPKLNFGASQTEIKDESAVEIERIYVLKEFHGTNVGQLLCEKAIDVARSRNADYVWLGVWEENPRAIKFYEKNGFAEFDRHVFRLGDEEQTDIMMKRPLGG